MVRAIITSGRQQSFGRSRVIYSSKVRPIGQKQAKPKLSKALDSDSGPFGLHKACRVCKFRKHKYMTIPLRHLKQHNAMPIACPKYCVGMVPRDVHYSLGMCS